MIVKTHSCQQLSPILCANSKMEVMRKRILMDWQWSQQMMTPKCYLINFTKTMCQGAYVCKYRLLESPSIMFLCQLLTNCTVCIHYFSLVHSVLLLYIYSFSKLLLASTKPKTLHKSLDYSAELQSKKQLILL